mmetsp:Transcript_28140/g.48877  ORF Transcript_28140/g.48877 Transcript_28140/m.48877 type:complete len:232 (-) Transcript_28140:109-804(-)
MALATASSWSTPALMWPSCVETACSCSHFSCRISRTIGSVAYALDVSNGGAGYSGSSSSNTIVSLVPSPPSPPSLPPPSPPNLWWSASSLTLRERRSCSEAFRLPPAPPPQAPADLVDEGDNGGLGTSSPVETGVSSTARVKSPRPKMRLRRASRSCRFSSLRALASLVACNSFLEPYLPEPEAPAGPRLSSSSFARRRFPLLPTPFHQLKRSSCFSAYCGKGAAVVDTTG